MSRKPISYDRYRDYIEVHKNNDVQPKTRNVFVGVVVEPFNDFVYGDHVFVSPYTTGGCTVEILKEDWLGEKIETICSTVNVPMHKVMPVPSYNRMIRIEAGERAAGKKALKVNHFNDLTPAEAERLALAIEELGEGLQILGKTLRHGFENFHPDDPNTTNRMLLEKEFGDIKFCMDLLAECGDINADAVSDRAYRKSKTVKQWLHHQTTPIKDFQTLITCAEIMAHDMGAANRLENFDPFTIEVKFWHGELRTASQVLHRVVFNHGEDALTTVCIGEESESKKLLGESAPAAAELTREILTAIWEAIA